MLESIFTEENLKIFTGFSIGLLSMREYLIHKFKSKSLEQQQECVNMWFDSLADGKLTLEEVRHNVVLFFYDKDDRAK